MNRLRKALNIRGVLVHAFPVTLDLEQLISDVAFEVEPFRDDGEVLRSLPATAEDLGRWAEKGQRGGGAYVEEDRVDVELSRNSGNLGAEEVMDDPFNVG